MKKISNQYKTKNTGKQAGYFWLSLLQWLRLLVLSFKRKKKQRAGIFLHEPDTTVLNNIHTPQIITNQKLPNMKPAKLLIKCGLMLLLTVCVTNAMAQTGPYQFTGDHSVCVNTTKEYGVPLNPGSTYVWTITPGTGYTMTPGATPNLISVTWTSPGTYTMTVVETSADGCEADPVSIIITVNPLPECSITGPNNICPGSTNTYSAPPGMTTYSWSISGNATIVGATNGETVSVLANNSCASFTLTLTITDANGCTSTCSETFDITAPPVVLTAPANFTTTSCQTQAEIDAAYTTWLAGVTSSGGCTLNVTNNAPAAPSMCGGTVTVTWTATSPCEANVTATATFTVTPATPVALTCPPSQTFCEVAGNNNYTIPPLVASGNCSGGPLTITYQVTGATTRSGTGTDASGVFNPGVSTITWTVTDACGNTSTCTTTITINPLPTPVITGPTPACVATETVVYTTPLNGCNTYSWTVSEGGTIIGSSTGNSITVQWTTPGTKTITVTETMCGTGCTATATTTVIVNPKPVTSPITHN